MGYKIIFKGHNPQTQSSTADIKKSDFDSIRKYISIHGEHFNDKLSRYAVSKMVNRNGLAHVWDVDQVMTAIHRLGNSISEKNKYDAMYVANMAYADYFGSSLKTESDVIQYVIDTMNDPDAKEGQVFNRFVADLMTHKIKLDFTNYL